MGLGSGSDEGGGGGGGGPERITFRSFLPLGGGWRERRTDGPPKRREEERERERENKIINAGQKRREGRERRLASNTNTTNSHCDGKEAWMMEGDRETGRRVENAERE